jgi:regulator of sigma E protease
MLNVLSYIWPFLLLITPIVFFHELGHFSVARLFGVKVETFSIGFGREIFGFTDRKGTRWKFSWIPFGGYVKFWGDLDAASTPDREKLEKATPQELSGSLMAKPVWQRMLVTAAGPVANFILAFVVYTVLFATLGDIQTPPVITGVVPGGVAAQAGLMPGDTMRAVNGAPVESFDDVLHSVLLNTGEPLVLTVLRKGKILTVSVIPQLRDTKDPFGNPTKQLMLGIQGTTTAKNAIIRHYNPIQAAGRAVDRIGFVLKAIFNLPAQFMHGKADSTQLSGPLGIAKVSHDVAGLGLLAFIELAAFISVSIGLVNLFPIPVLDGGHLLYYGVEAVLGRPMSAKAQDIGFRLGLMLMLGLMLFVTWNDVVHHLNLF